MKRCVIVSVFCIVCALLLPLALGRSIPESAPAPVSGPAETLSPTASETPAPAQQTPAPTPSADETAVITVLVGGQARQMTLAEYLPGVLAGEMPAAFEEEALRAQAVAARTFVLYHQVLGCAAHPEAAVCDDPSCCQVFLEEPALREKWGDGYDTYWARIQEAVTATDGEYLTYEGEPILACFHSSSAGRTENSGVLWGTSLPYLVSVDSPETAEDVPNYISTLEVSPEDFRDTILAALPEADLSTLPPEWVGESALDSSGRVAAIRVGGLAVPGTRMRTLFSLRSTNFTLEWTGRSFLFTVTGFGHGAGMSQYGANVMAQEGSTYGEILSHYYPGTVLTTLA